MLKRDRPEVVLGLLILLAVGALAAQAPAKDPAADRDVLGAQRLFSAWAEGQLRFRGYPGMAVGVVSDQRLVWSRGFGLANVAARSRSRRRPSSAWRRTASCSPRPPSCSCASRAS